MPNCQQQYNALVAAQQAHATAVQQLTVANITLSQRQTELGQAQLNHQAAASAVQQVSGQVATTQAVLDGALTAYFNCLNQ